MLGSTQLGLGAPSAGGPSKGSVPPPPLGATGVEARSLTPVMPLTAIASPTMAAPNPVPTAQFESPLMAAVTELSMDELSIVDGGEADAELTRRALAATDMVVLPTVPTVPTVPTAHTSPSAAMPSSPSADSEASNEPAAGWSPTSTKPQRSKLLRSGEPGNAAGRYSVQGSSVEYVDSPSNAEVWNAAVPMSEPVADDDPNARARRYTPKQRPAQRRGRAAATIRGQGDRPENMTTLPDRPRGASAAMRSTVPGRPALARPGQPGGAPLSLPSSVRVDPSASIPSPPPPQPTAAGYAGTPASYEPLPRDRESFEAYMRKRAQQDPGQPHMRTNWKEQETLLIPRDSLPTDDPGERLWRRVPWMRLAAVLALILTGSATYWLRQATQTGPTVHPVSPTHPGAAAEPAAEAVTVATTLIATEPSGAELLLSGAVLGNTPFQVNRPTQGDETYLLRLRGFESQLVRLSPQSGNAIRVTLVPQGSAR